MSIKAAVLGVGSMGRNHARIYRELAETELVAVADTRLELANAVAQTNLTKAYGDYRELLKKEKPDIVSIVVPTKNHFQVTLDALEMGCHVLVEKPLAATVEQAQIMIETAARLDRELMVGHVVRFDPAIQELKRRLEAGELGKIFQIRARRLGPFPARVQDVGVVIDLATHDLDVIRYITGQEIVQVYATTKREIHSQHEDILLGTIILADGTMALLDINWLTPTKIRELTVTGTRGMFLADSLKQDLYFYENQEAANVEWEQMSLLKGVSEGAMVRFPLRRFEPLKAELQAFARSAGNGGCVPVNGQDGLATLQAALALVRSGREQRVIEVPA